MQVPWNFRFGIVILGDSAVGKSSLLHRFTEGTFDESRQSPLGIDFKVHNMNFDPDVVIKLLLWDTAGQERFSQKEEMANYHQPVRGNQN
ncbi:hypothetical protein cypCar_00024016 [Cyprinus carpio]|nr:hypothetical protein cypCar_00024016 [Cyprinus carpio]